MNYKEKIKYAEKILKMQSNNRTEDEINIYIENLNISQKNMEDVRISVESQTFFTQKKKIRRYMLGNTLSENLDEFDDMDNEVFESLQYDIMFEIKTSSSQKVSDLLKQKRSRKEIIETVANPFFLEEEIIGLLDGPIQKEKNELMIGGFLLFIGLLGFFATYSNDGGSTTFFRITFFIGIGFLFKDRYY